MANKEIIFRNDSLSGRELHFDVDDRNRVSWRIIPYGEEGITRPLKDIHEVEHFMERYAVLKGFTSHPEQTSENSGDTTCS